MTSNFRNNAQAKSSALLFLFILFLFLLTIALLVVLLASYSDSTEKEEITGTNYNALEQDAVFIPLSQSITDTDSDGIIDCNDNCPDNCNVQQLDADKDGKGDVCDTTPGCGGCSVVQCEQQC